MNNDPHIISMYDHNLIQTPLFSVTIFIQYISFKNFTNQLNIQTNIHFTFIKEFIHNQIH